MAISKSYPHFMNLFNKKDKITYIIKQTFIRAYYSGSAVLRMIDLEFGYIVTLVPGYYKYIDDVLNSSSILILNNNNQNNCNIVFDCLEKVMLIVDLNNQIYPRIYVRTQLPFVNDIDFEKLTTRTNPKYIEIDLELKFLNVRFDNHAISELIRTHYILNHGRIPCFGQITGYVFYTDKSRGYDFDINGSVLQVSKMVDLCLSIDFPTLVINRSIKEDLV